MLGGGVVPTYEFTSYQIPRNHPDAPRVNDRGYAVFESRREVKDFEARTRGTRFEYHYD